MAKYVIVGGVAGGMSCAARLRRLDEKAEIIVFEKGEYISFANCGLPYHIGGVIKERNSLLVQTPKAIKSRFNIDVRVKNEVIDINREKKIVKVKDLVNNKEYEETYDKLLLSPGAEPIKPPIEGIDNNKIFTLRTIPDMDKIIDYIEKNNVRTAVIVGAGFIGLEMAENLKHRGINVIIIEALKQVLNVLDYEMACFIHRELRMKGVELYLDDGVVKFEDNANKIKITLKSGKNLIVDMVILSIGVKPEVKLAEKAGLKLGPRKGILVNEYLQTSDENIYAIGDAVEILNPVIGKNMIIPLAGPANRQGREVATNLINGNVYKYYGSIGTGIAKIFDITAAVTGATEKVLKQENIPYETVIVHPNDHASYYPGATPISIKVIYAKDSNNTVLGAQVVGYNGVDKRIDTLSIAVRYKMSVIELKNFELAYAPPYSSAKDPVNIAGYVAENIIRNLVKVISWEEILNNSDNYYLIDVRTKEEYKAGTIKNAINIPVDEIRSRLKEIPADKKICIFCRVGLRGYVAARILYQNGYKEVYNLTGGYYTYSTATEKQTEVFFSEEYDTGMAKENKDTQIKKDHIVREVNACGLSCPGPIIKLKEEINKIDKGDRLIIQASDPGFYNDVRSWANATNNKVISLVSEKGIIKAEIEKGDMSASNQVVSGGGNDKTIIVFDNDLDKAIAAMIITNGALAMGRKVTVFFTFWGLSVIKKRKTKVKVKKNFIEKMFGMMLPKNSTDLSLSKMNMFGMGPLMIRNLMKSKNVPSLEDMIDSALKNGARFIACQMSMELMGIKKEELIDGVEVGGVATYLEFSEKADNNLFI